MNLRIEKVKDYNNKILTLSLSFKIGTNLTLNRPGFLESSTAGGGGFRPPV